MIVPADWPYHYEITIAWGDEIITHSADTLWEAHQWQECYKHVPGAVARIWWYGWQPVPAVHGRRAS